jgi:hypothetical protein
VFVVSYGRYLKTPEFWHSDVMQDIKLPSVKDNVVTQPKPGTGSAVADLGIFLDWNTFGLQQWVELVIAPIKHPSRVDG